MTTHPAVAAVTERIVRRSASRRRAYAMEAELSDDDLLWTAAPGRPRDEETFVSEPPRAARVSVTSGRPTLGGVPLALLAYASYAGSDASVHALGGSLPSFEVAFLGAAVGVLLLPFAWDRGLDVSTVTGLRHPVRWLVRAIAAIVGGLGSIIAFTRLPMPEAFALIFLMPFCVTVLSVLFLQEKIGPWRWAAVIAGFVGVLIVLRPGLRALDWGYAAAIACALSSAVTVVMLRKGGSDEGMIAKLLPGVMGSGVTNGLLMIATFRMPNLAETGLLAGYACLGWLGQYLLLVAARREAASRIAPPQYTQMIWAVLFSYLLFRQPVDVVTFVGISVIIGAGLLTWSRERLRRRTARESPSP